MTFDSTEKSSHSAITNELMLFSTKDGSYYYTSADVPINFGGNNYVPVPITSPTVEATGDVNQSNINFTMAITDLDGQHIALPRLNIAFPYPSRIGLSIYRYHHITADYATIWTGLVKQITLVDNEATIECETLLTAMRRLGLADKFQTLCNFFLYSEFGGRCPVVLEDHARSGTVSVSPVGNTLVISGIGIYGDNWFAGGFIEAANGDTRDILASEQASGIITITGAFPSSTVQSGSAVTLYDGCNHTTDNVNGCRSPRFAVETNDGEAYGGYPFGPDKNVFISGLS